MRACLWIVALVSVAGCSTEPSAGPPPPDPVIPVEAPVVAPALTEAPADAATDETDAVVQADAPADEALPIIADAPSTPIKAVTSASDSTPAQGTVQPKTADVKTVEPATEPLTSDGAATTAAPKEQATPAKPKAPSGPRTYALTTRGAFVGVIVRYDRNALIKGHDHVLVAGKHSGSVVWNADDVAACNISVDVPVSSLVVDPPGSRKREGFEGETPDKDRASIRDNALGKSQLNAASHPTIAFRSSSCAASGDKVLVKGTMTLRGVTKPVSTTMRISTDGDAFLARGALNFSHTQFGFKPFSAALGALKNDDALTLDLSFKGVAK